MIGKLLRKFRYKLDSRIAKAKLEKSHEMLRQEILSYYSDHASADKEITDAVGHLKSHRLLNRLIPSAKPVSIRKKLSVGTDRASGLSYVMHEGKKLFFKQLPTAKALKYKYMNLMEEQSPHSPHLYVTQDFDVDDGSVLYDIGSAEGIFALSNVERARHIVLFEGDEAWLGALRATFEPWKEKVTIVPKFVSDFDDENNITIDTFIKQYGDSLAPDFVKIDVEGAEMKVLKGMKGHLDRKGLKIVITTYHYQEDYREISDCLSRHGFTQHASKGVTLVGLDKHTAPFFRKALIRGVKE